MSITRDTRPPDPIQQAQRAKLDDLARALRHTHSALLEAVKLDFEKLNGKVGGPFQLFQLVTNEPFFQWLRPLSGLMASLDELIDEKRLLTESEIGEVRSSIVGLFDARDVSGFGANFQSRIMDSTLIAGHRDDVLQKLEALT
jgi:hypothetical protein